MSGFPPLLSSYAYAHPESLIAYAPLPERSESRLLLVRKNPERGLPKFEHTKFSELPQIVADNAELKKHLLVRNRSRVLPARFYARRATGSRHEVVLAERVAPQEWNAIIRHVFKIKKPEVLKIEGSEEYIEVNPPGRIRFRSEHVTALLDRVGQVPLPPYIKREVNAEDRERYQTVWAQGEALSAAAPTASLHFTDEVWQQLQAQGLQSADVYLHVGRGTFEPLREFDLAKAELHEEAFSVTAENVRKIQAAASVWAVGTTACRLTETLSHLSGGADFLRLTQKDGDLSGWTRLFIKPGYEFQKVQALLTNFHLPQSSLLVLVAIFAGSWTLAEEAYREAVNKNYRLFSYGDASLWI